MSKSSLTVEVSSATIVAMKDNYATKKKIDSNLALIEGNVVTRLEGLSAQSIPSRTSRATSSDQRSREKVRHSEAFYSDGTSSQHSDTTLKLSNSWSATGDNEGSPREAKHVVPVKPQSSRLLHDIGDHQKSVKKSITGNSDKSKVRKKTHSSKTTHGATQQGDEALSDNGTWRPLINGETKMCSKKSAKMIDKEKTTNSKMVEKVEKVGSSGDKKGQQHRKRRSGGYCEDGSLKKEIKDVVPQLPSRRSRSSALVRSQSLPSLEITESNSTPSRRAKRDDRRKDNDRRIGGSSPRRSSRANKNILSISEHRPKSLLSQTHAGRSRRVLSSQRLSSNYHATVVPDHGAQPLDKTDEISFTPRKTRSPARGKEPQSEHTVSKPTSSRRRQLSNAQSPREQHTNTEHRQTNGKTRTDENEVRRLPSKDALRQSEQNPSRPRQAGRSSFLSSSWGDLTLEYESDLEDKSSKKGKKNWNAQCSWDLSQLILMEELLSAQPEKEDSKTEKVKEALFALTKKLLGSRKDDKEMVKTDTTMDDSCRNNVTLFDDSYQQNFGSTNIDFGMFGTGSRSAGNVPTDQSTEHGFHEAHQKTFPVLANEENNEVHGTQNTTTRNMNETTERENFSNNDKTSDDELHRFCSQRSLLATNKASEVLSHTLTPNTQGSSSSNRRGRIIGRVDNKEKKASSWRELYQALTPGQSTSSSQPRRATSLIRKLSSKRIAEQRPSSFDDDFISPRTVTTIVFPSRTITTIALEASSDNEKGSEATKKANTRRNSVRQRGARRRFSAGGTRTSNSSESRELDLLQW